MSKVDVGKWPAEATEEGSHLTEPTPEDPYQYRAGFSNLFISEAIRGVIPKDQNTPQRAKYNLYSEQLNGSAVVAPRNEIRHVWMYRIRPSVVHGPVRHRPDLNQHASIESDFTSSNPRVESSASQQAWDPFPLLDAANAATPERSVNFIQGIRTIGGKGDVSLENGLALHIYSANADMGREAFCNNDGEMLILPQKGRLDIRTELGCLMICPGEVFTMPAGMRFRVQLPDGPSRGYIQEVYAAQHELPELGMIGTNGTSLLRHFYHPSASYFIDENPWTVTCKFGGIFHSYNQNHTPFDVVGWHGNYVPVKYNLNKFINLANVSKDQADPTIYGVYTVKPSKTARPLSEFLIFTEKWITAEGTFRPPYYHRNMSTEIMGLVFGQYGGSSHVLAPGGLSYEGSYMPHGETYETWKEASTRKLEPIKICEGTMAFMFHIGGSLKLTKWALHGEGAKSLHQSSPSQWDTMTPHFYDHVDQVTTDLEKEKLKSKEREEKQNEIVQRLDTAFGE